MDTKLSTASPPAEFAIQATEGKIKLGVGGGAFDWAVLLVLVAIWGSTYAVIKVAVETINPLWVVAGRLIVGTACLSLFFGVQQMAAARSQPVSRAAKLDVKSITMFASVGVFATAVPFLMYAEGARLADSAVMAICNGATPFFTAILAHLFLQGDRLTWRRTVGVMLGFAGLVVLVAPQMADGMTASLAGIGLAVAGAALYAGGNIVTRRAPRVSPVLSSIIINGAGTLAILPVALLVAPIPENPSLASVIALMLLGVFSTGVGMSLYVLLIQRAGPMFVSLVTYLSPLWATVVGVSLMGEPLKPSMLGALALVLAGVGIANARMKPQS